jgi:hypothetical protein
LYAYVISKSGDLFYLSLFKSSCVFFVCWQGVLWPWMGVPLGVLLIVGWDPVSVRKVAVLLNLLLWSGE